VTRQRSGSDEDFDLGPREREILKALILAHVSTGEPVGSKTVAVTAREVGSAATVRAAMGVLEDKGLLVQPHTSAGRVPTDAAYRLYVDRLMGRPRMAATSATAIDAALERVRGELDDLLVEASRLLSRHSAQVGIAVAPELRRIVVERIEFARLAGRRVMAILVGRSGVVHHRMLELDEPVDQDELDRVSRMLNEQFGGMTLPTMREALLHGMAEERARLDRMFARSLELGRRAVEVEDGDADVFVEGTANLIDQPEFADLGRMRALLSALERKERLVRLLGSVLESRGVQVLLGSEAPGTLPDGLSVVASRYRAGARVMGAVAVVGPTRMPYARTVALVDHLARRLTLLLTDVDSGGVPE